MLEYKNRKIFSQKVTLQIDLKKFLWLKKFKILFCVHMLLMTLKDKNYCNFLQNRIAQKNKKTNQPEFKVEKVIQRKGDKLNGKVIIKG